MKKLKNLFDKLTNKTSMDGIQQAQKEQFERYQQKHNQRRSNVYAGQDFFDDEGDVKMNSGQSFNQSENSPNPALLSIEYKEKGNECLKQDQPEEAVNWYTKSLVSNTTQL